MFIEHDFDVTDLNMTVNMTLILRFQESLFALMYCNIYTDIYIYTHIYSNVKFVFQFGYCECEKI